MRNVVATFLLVCVGILLPASAASMRVCLLEKKVLSLCQESPCCDDCERDAEPPDPCCVDLEQLPDFSIPQSTLELPPAVVAELVTLPGLEPTTAQPHGEMRPGSAPIRGPDSPSAYRAVLGIWRL